MKRVEPVRGPVPTLSLRHIVLAMGLLETAVWALLVYNGLFSGSDPATRGIDHDVAILATGIFASTAAPALLLAVSRKWLRLAFALALAPPASLVAVVLWSIATG